MLTSVMIKLQYEKTEQYAERYDNWLNMRSKPDGSFKDEACRSVADKIVSFRILDVFKISYPRFC